MYYTGIDPFTGKSVYVAREYEDKKMQRALLQWNRRENHSLVREALQKCGRSDLIGNGPDCLVPPERKSISQKSMQNKQKSYSDSAKRKQKGPNHIHNKKRNVK